MPSKRFHFMRLRSRFAHLLCSPPLSLFLLVMVMLTNFFLAGFTVSNPKQSFVVDEVGVLKNETVDYLNRINAQLKPSGAQIAVAIVSDLQGNEIEESANKTFRSWGIGDKTKNNGVLILVSLNERKIRIEVGYGLEGAIPDAVAGRIIRQKMQKPFRDGDYDLGIVAAVETLSKEIAKEYSLDLSQVKPPVTRPAHKRSRSRSFILFAILIYVLFNAFYRGPRGGGRGGNSLWNLNALFWTLFSRGGFGGFGGFGGNGNGGYRGGYGGGSSGGGGASGNW